jgi:hypothetical protein
MKKSLLLCFCFLLVFSSIKAQYGLTTSKPLPAINNLTPVLQGIPLTGGRAYCCSWTGSFLSYDLPLFNNQILYNSGLNGQVDFNKDGDMVVIESMGVAPRLYLQDFNTSSYTLIGTISGYNAVTYNGAAFTVGLAINTLTDRYYSLVIDYNGWGNCSSYLFEINPVTLVATLIGKIPNVDACMTLAYSGRNDALYTIDFTYNKLVKVNPQNANSTTVGSISFSNQPNGYFCESDFDDATNELYVSLFNDNVSGTQIHMMNIKNASSTVVQTIPIVQLSMAINSSTTPVPIKWYFVFLLFLIPAIIIIYRKLF